MTYKNRSDQLRLNALHLAIGETTYKEQCPSCLRADGNFSLTRVNDGIIYNCFRDACKYKGFVPNNSWNQLGKQKDKQFKPKIFKESTISIPDEVAEICYNKYELTKEQLEENNVVYAPNTGRLVFDLHNFNGPSYGKLAKVIIKNKYDGPKAVCYFEKEETKLYCPSFSLLPSNSITLVEDCISAIKLSYITPTIALLGTSLSGGVVEELIGKVQHINICLDPDALTSAIVMRAKYSLLFSKGINIVQLKDDPKDTPYKELEEINWNGE